MMDCLLRSIFMLWSLDQMGSISAHQSPARSGQVVAVSTIWSNEIAGPCEKILMLLHEAIDGDRAQWSVVQIYHRRMISLFYSGWTFAELDLQFILGKPCY